MTNLARSGCSIRRVISIAFAIPFAVLSSTGVATAQSAEPASAVGQTNTDKSSQVRFRWALHAVGGAWLVPGHEGGQAGGIGVQLGAQISDAIGVYYSGTAGVGTAYGTAGVFCYNPVMFDYTLGGRLQVGAGPSLDLMAIGSVGSIGSAGAAGIFFGINGRIGLALGDTSPGAHGHFMVGIEAHPSFAAGAVPTTVFLTLGGGRF